MALSWVDTSYQVSWWEYDPNGTTKPAIRTGPSTSYAYVNSSPVSRYTGSDGDWVGASEVSDGNPAWIYYYDSTWGWGWSATWSGTWNYFTWQENETVSQGYWSGTAYLYYYWPTSATTYNSSWFTRASRTGTSFTTRSTGSSSATTYTVTNSSSTITLTASSRGSTHATISGTKTVTTPYTLKGWRSSNSGNITSSATYSLGTSYSSASDINMYAVFTAGTQATTYSNNQATTSNLSNPSNYSTSTTYTVTLSNADSLGSNNTLTATKTTPYTFSNWKNSSGTAITLPYTFTANTTITANFTAGTSSTTAVTLPTPTKSGYRFNGWSTTSGATSGTLTGGSSYTPTANVTLYATWVADSFTLTLANSESWTGTYAPTGGGTYSGGTSVTIEQPIQSGWKFIGWTDSSGNVVSNSNPYTFDMPSENTTYTANVARQSYTIQYNANTGSGSMSSSTHYIGVAKALNTNTFTKTNYLFVGWSISATATSATYTDGQSVTNLSTTDGATITLYAIWMPFTKTYIFTNNSWHPTLKYIYTNGDYNIVEEAEFGATWGDFEFSYDEGWSASNNYFYVSNSGNGSGTVSLSYTAATGYTNITGTILNESYSEVSSASIEAGGNQKFYLRLSGTPSTSFTNELVGQIIVSSGDFVDSWSIYATATIPEETITNGYTVAAVDGSTYTFVDNGSGYYESNNQGVDSSYALARTTITTDGTKYVIVEYQCDSEIYYDYGLISTVDTTFAASSTADTNILNSRPSNYGDGLARAVKKINLGQLTAGTHTFDTKFIKDSSSAVGSDSMKFKVTFVDTVPAILQSSITYYTVNGASYGWSGSYGWWYPKNRNIASSAALIKVRIIANGTDHFYMDCIQSSESANDFGLVSTDGGSFDTTNSIDSSNVLRSFQNATNDSYTTLDLGVLSAGTHDFIVKYRKNDTLDYFDDCMQFRVREGTATLTSRSYKGDSVTVEPVSGSTYTFELNDNGYYESNNQGVDSSYALTKVTVISRYSRYIVLDCINYAEGGFDYGILSTKGNTLTASTTADTSNVLQSFAAINRASDYRVSYGKVYGLMTFYVKYRKDSSQSSNNDSFQFKVNWLSELPEILNSSWSYASAGGTYSFVDHPFDSSYGWIVPGNKGVDSSAAVSIITINANGTDNVYLDYYQSSEYNYDYAIISAIGETLSTSASADSSYLSRTYGVSGYGSIDLGVLSSGTHTLYIKYLKNDSEYSGSDVCGFVVRFGGDSITPFYSIDSYDYLATATVSGASYGFADLSSTPWRYYSLNIGVASSAAVARIGIRANGFDNVYIDGYSFGESTFDYGIVGTIGGSALGTTYTADTTDVAFTTSGQQETVVTYNAGVLSAGWHYFYVKYRKDDSVDGATDTFYVNVRYDSTVPDVPAAG